jgi:transposase
MGEVSTIGLDIAKSVFQVHGVDDTGTVVMRKRINRSKVLQFFHDLSPCLVGLETCLSAHIRAAAARRGHSRAVCVLHRQLR